MKFLIKRVALTPIAAFGVLIGPDGYPFTNTLERPWANNQRGVSCVPTGHFKAIRCRRSADYNYSDSPKFGDTFQIIVPGRSLILFHKGNLSSDSHGCVLIGERYHVVNGIPGIADSAVGFNEFLAKVAGIDEFALEIRDC